MIPKAKTSLYKGRIYVKTANGNTYLWNLASNWSDPIDANIQTKLENRGYKYTAITTDKEKEYFFIDTYQRILLGTDIVAGDFAAAAPTNTFVITNSGGAVTLGGWSNVETFTVTLSQAAIDAGKALDMDTLVIELNNMLAKVTGSAGIYKASVFYEFFRLDVSKVGLKLKPLYTSSVVGNYLFTLTNGSGTFLSASSGIRIAPSVASSALTSKMQTDLLTAITAIASDVTLVEEKKESNGNSYQRITIKNGNISELFADINKVDESFIVNY